MNSKKRVKRKTIKKKNQIPLRRLKAARKLFLKLQKSSMKTSLFSTIKKIFFKSEISSQ